MFPGPLRRSPSGAGSREPGAGSREPGAGSREPAAYGALRRAPNGGRPVPARAHGFPSARAFPPVHSPASASGPCTAPQPWTAGSWIFPAVSR
ncbi:hypothetical protein GR170_09710 [Pseudooceanicola sp. GBMRC 2024]|uniref:Uncharacterized protein n=1 Tax=Pseudooceanicola albus TaxID=2692189 RepID=A0A6L7G276_9RHOB|nr:hypothetical protein [Pseudooceanicola albus]